MARTIYVQSGARIKVVGCGGGGCNAITRMVRENIRGVEFIAMNTDAQHLAITEAPTRIQLGEKNTRGLGLTYARLPKGLTNPDWSLMACYPKNLSKSKQI